MTATFSWNIATTTTPDGVFPKAKIIVRGATARVVDREYRDLVSKDGVDEVRVTGNRTRLVTFTDGTEWHVLRDKGCGCGGGR